MSDAIILSDRTHQPVKQKPPLNISKLALQSWHLKENNLLLRRARSYSCLPDADQIISTTEPFLLLQKHPIVSYMICASARIAATGILQPPRCRAL